MNSPALNRSISDNTVRVGPVAHWWHVNVTSVATFPSYKFAQLLLKIAYVTSFCSFAQVVVGAPASCHFLSFKREWQQIDNSYYLSFCLMRMIFSAWGKLNKSQISKVKIQRRKDQILFGNLSVHPILCSLSDQGLQLRIQNTLGKG